MKRIQVVRMHMPFMTEVEYVQHTVQTDKVTNIPCGTSGGTVVTFDVIEVVNILDRNYLLDTVRNYTVNYDKIWIFDKIHHEINQICSRSSLDEIYITKFDTLDEVLKDRLTTEIEQFVPGLTIMSIRVTKPIVPRAILNNYVEVEEQKTKLRVARETQQLVELTAATERKRLLIGKSDGRGAT